MFCELEYDRQDGDRHILRCRNCGGEVRSRYSDPAKRRHPCGTPRIIANGPFTTEEVESLFDGESDPTLLGNRIAALTTALGIPPCGGCAKRKAWLNKAHLWLRG